MDSLFSHATLLLVSALFALIQGVAAEKHTVTFDNQCGFGSPRLVQKGNILSTGDPFTSDGPFNSAIAYLQTGNCLLNAEGCTSVEITLVNPTCPGCGSSVDISLIPPLKFSVPTAFSYQGGCKGQGTTCSSANCKSAFFVPDDNQVQVQCQDNDVNLLITFCPGDSTPKPATSLNIGVPLPAHTTSQTHIPTTTAVASVPIVSKETTSSVAASPRPSSNAPQCSRNRSRRRTSLSGSQLHVRSPRLVHERKRSINKQF